MNHARKSYIALLGNYARLKNAPDRQVRYHDKITTKICFYSKQDH